MELTWLQTFVVAAQTMNFHQAAELLHLAQPTVSLHVQKLEQQLGVELFQRQGRSIALTPAGRRYLEHARRVLDAYDAGREDMSRWRQGYTESVRIAVSPLIATTILPRWIQRYGHDHPATEFSILVRESGAILDAFLDGRCDIAFSRMPLSHSELQCDLLYRDPLTLVAPADGLDVEAPLPTAADLFAEYPVFTHNHPEYWDGLLMGLRKNYPNLRTMTISQVHVTLHWIGEGMGVSFLPASTVQRALLSGHLVEVPFTDFPLPVASTYMVYGRGKQSLAVQSFLQFVDTYMRDRKY